MGLIVIADILWKTKYIMAANSFYNPTKQEFDRLFDYVVFPSIVENDNHLRILIRD